ncbi:MAG: nicotinate-nucleotide--dimethylbenzimidazole phosphoribosyltransferase [Caulobacteraceae bacterium]
MILTLPAIAAVDTVLAEALRAKLDGKAKPLGSLGRLERLAEQIGLIQGRLDPAIGAICVQVYAGDHGLNAEGVSAYPSAVTAAMVATYLMGRACVNAFAAVTEVEVMVIDAGVDADLTPDPRLIDAKIRKGTRNAARAPALTADEVDRALARGVRFGAEAKADVVALGEMGIGNTASAALIMHRLLPAPLEDCVGLGAGHDAAGLARKMAAVRMAAARSPAAAPLDVLAEFGGLEIVMMVGAVIGAAANRKVVLVDGFITTVAVLAAVRLAPAVREYCVFAHASAERGHRLLLEGLAAEPLLDLGLRLGEGTGAVLAAPLLRAAARLLTDVADLSEVLAGAPG